jgi:transcriptional regulator with XRE-family HTH domain
MSRERQLVTVDERAARSGFARALQRHRQQQGLTQADLAERLGYTTPEVVSRYERGDQEPRLSALLRLSAALGVPASELLPDMTGADAAAPAKEREPNVPQPDLAAWVAAQSALARLYPKGAEMLWRAERALKGLAGQS